jgi:aromatic ring-opening dioxygenase catalytic subunit (LigB family)
MGKPTPLIFVSHGSTMMLGEESVVTRDWQEIGRKAERRGIKGVVMMVSFPALSLKYGSSDGH